ncbi:MAG: diadenylate cyclase CdaA [Clostridia bacterium]|nr:diadenylate cyclase CdaA [Clostridia bacterium]
MNLQWLSDGWESILKNITNISLPDIIDIACVSVLFYYLYIFVRDRRAGKLAMGVILIFTIQLITSVFDMYVMQFLLQNIFQMGLLILVVLFQPELRSMLEKMGGQSLKGIRGIGENRDNAETLHMIDEVTEAVQDMSDAKTGALIVFERSTRLGDLGLTGTVINADPESFLIKNIFYNKAPLHDGAMIIRKNRLHAAGCLLPLSENPDIIKDLGTRHRAGIGMSENSDAIVVIVSEETGTVSLACEGRLTRDFTGETLKEALRSYLMPEAESSVSVAKRTLNKLKLPVHTDKKQDNGGDQNEAE